MELPRSSYIDGREHSAMVIKKQLMNATRPQVFQKTIDTWPAITWSLDEFTEMFGDVMTKFKLYNKYTTDEGEAVTKTNPNKLSHKYTSQNDAEAADTNTNARKRRKTSPSTSEKKLVLETECFYVEGTFTDFKEWLLGATNQTNKELAKYKKSLFWCYADYNYMAELFTKYPSALDAVDWSQFGFPGRNGLQSTIWVGSEGAYTPCHQDSYGLNLVAQICGVKRWLLLPPEESRWLHCTRIPYEESSVFTSFSKEKLKTNINCIQVDLRPGEVLFVPKHWWHFVECLEPSISINTWIELESDTEERLKESLVQTFVYGMKIAEKCPIEQWLNPGQIAPQSIQCCLNQVKVALNERSKSKESTQSAMLTNDLLINCLCETEVLDKIICAMKERLKIEA